MSKGKPIPKKKLNRAILYTTDWLSNSLPKKGFLGTSYCRIDLAGSWRRRKQQIRDLDFVVSGPVDKMLDCTLRFSPQEVRTGSGLRFIEGGPLKQHWTYLDVPIDLYFATEDEHGACLLFATGSKEFNIKMRRRAIEMGYRLNRHGLWEAGTNQLVAAASERDIFEALDMRFHHPKQRS